MALPDTDAIGEFMAAFGQTIRTAPTTEITREERVLRARLVVEEALEFAEAMGCTVTTPDGSVVGAKSVAVDIDPDRDIDLVEAADALADINVVAKGSALTLGIDVDAVFEIVHATNMAKLGPDGRPIRRESDGKVLKPAGWQPPTEAIRALLLDAAGPTDSYTGRPVWEN